MLLLKNTSKYCIVSIKAIRCGLNQDDTLQTISKLTVPIAPAPIALTLVRAGTGSRPVHHHAPAPAPEAVGAAGGEQSARAGGELPGGEGGEAGEVLAGACTHWRH